MGTRGGSSIKSTSINGVKLYSLSSQRSLASWLQPKKRRALRKDQDYLQRVELIQDLKFETASTKIKVTADGDYVIASGIYPPQVKVFELRELSLKFERHLISEIVNFQVLSEDYSKIAFLCADRSVCLHAKYGSHYSLRIPRMGRDIAYDYWSCDLLCAASSSDVYRINLDQGRFLSSLNSQSSGINVISRSEVHGLVACGGEDGAVECFDTRRKSSIGRIDAIRHTGDADHEITALQFDAQGYLMAVGNSAGKISIYDLRRSDPIRIKDHMYGSPIVNIQWHQTLNSEEPKLVTADRSIVRIWDPNTGNNMTTIEPNSGVINDVCMFRQSGLMLLALDNVQLPAYFVPALGPAPKWCSYLENLTEEMDESSQPTIYDDFKFLTKEEIERLNLSSCIGTNLVRAYMHGYFVHYQLYKKALANVNPFAYEDYKNKLKEEKMEAARGTRITEVRKLPKVNRVLYAKLNTESLADEQTTNVDDTTTKKSKRTKGLSKNILDDERFKAIFSNEDFEVDELAPEFLALHPQTSKKQTSLVDEHFEPVMEDEEYGTNDSDSPASSEDEFYGENNKMKSSKRMRLYEVKDERHAEAFLDNVSLAKEDALPLGERVNTLEKQQNSFNNVKFGPGGSREISFVSRSKKSKTDFNKKKDEVEEPQTRRNIKSLGLKPGKAEFYAMGGKGGGGKWKHPKGKGKGK